MPAWLYTVLFRCGCGFVCLIILVELGYNRVERRLTLAKDRPATSARQIRVRLAFAAAIAAVVWSSLCCSVWTTIDVYGVQRYMISRHEMQLVGPRSRAYARIILNVERTDPTYHAAQSVDLKPWQQVLITVEATDGASVTWKGNLSEDGIVGTPGPRTATAKDANYAVLVELFDKAGVSVDRSGKEIDAIASELEIVRRPAFGYGKAAQEWKVLFDHVDHVNAAKHYSDAAAGWWKGGVVLAVWLIGMLYFARRWLRTTTTLASTLTQDR